MKAISVRIASFIGSGINGNVNHDTVGNLSLIASFIGSGINGNYLELHCHYGVRKSSLLL